MSDREIYSNIADKNLCTNKIKTCKYSLITFFPKNMFNQFSKLANVYFLVYFFFLKILKNSQIILKFS